MGVLRLYDGFVYLIQCLRGVNVGIAMKRTAKDLVAARVGSWPYIKGRLSNDKGFGNEASATHNVDLDNMLGAG